MKQILIYFPVEDSKELEELQHILSELIHTLSHPDELEQQKTVHLLSRILLHTFMLEE